jgi:hypothetical protein
MTSHQSVQCLEAFARKHCSHIGANRGIVNHYQNQTSNPDYHSKWIWAHTHTIVG